MPVAANREKPPNTVPPTSLRTHWLSNLSNDAVYRSLENLYESGATESSPVFLTFTAQVTIPDLNLASQVGFRHIASHVKSVNDSLNTGDGTNADNAICTCQNTGSESAPSYATIAGSQARPQLVTGVSPTCPTLNGNKLTTHSTPQQASISPLCDDIGFNVSIDYSASKETVAKVCSLMWTKPRLGKDNAPIFPVLSYHDGRSYSIPATRKTLLARDIIIVSIKNPAHKDLLTAPSTPLDHRAVTSLMVSLPYPSWDILGAPKERLLNLATSALPATRTDAPIDQTWSVIADSLNNISPSFFYVNVKTPLDALPLLKTGSLQPLHQLSLPFAGGYLKCRFAKPPPPRNILGKVLRPGAAPNPGGSEEINAMLAEYNIRSAKYQGKQQKPTAPGEAVSKDPSINTDKDTPAGQDSTHPSEGLDEDYSSDMQGDQNWGDVDNIDDAVKLTVSDVFAASDDPSADTFISQDIEETDPGKLAPDADTPPTSACSDTPIPTDSAAPNEESVPSTETCPDNISVSEVTINKSSKSIPLRNSFSALDDSSPNDDAPSSGSGHAAPPDPPPATPRKSAPAGESTPAATLPPPSLPSRDYSNPKNLFSPIELTTPLSDPPTPPPPPPPPTKPAPIPPSPMPPKHRKPPRDHSPASTPQPFNKPRLGGPSGDRC